MGNAEHGVWIFSGESAQDTHLVRDALAFRNHPPSPPQRPRDDLPQFLHLKAIEQVIEGAFPQTVDRNLGIRIAGQHHHGDVRRPGRQLTQKDDAGFASPKPNAAQHQLGRPTPEGFTGAGQIPGFRDMMACGFQRSAHERARVPPFLDDEDAGGIRSRWRWWSHGSE